MNVEEVLLRLLTMTILAMVCAATAGAGRARAQSQASSEIPLTDPEPGARRDTVTIGAGIALLPSYEGSNDYVVIPAGALRGTVSGFSFSSRGTELSLDLIRDKGSLDFQAGPVVAVNFNRVGRIVDDRVEALGSRKVALELGGYVGLAKTGVVTSAYDTLAISVSYRRDVAGIHGSYIIEPSISYGTPLSRKSFVGIGASATLAGDGYARSYFAVDPAGSLRSRLPTFAAPRGGFKDFTLSGLASYSLSGDLRRGPALFALGSYSRLQGDFALSPVTSIAGSRAQLFGAIGIGYTF